MEYLVYWAVGCASASLNQARQWWAILEKPATIRRRYLYWRFYILSTVIVGCSGIVAIAGALAFEHRAIAFAVAALVGFLPMEGIKLIVSKPPQALGSRESERSPVGIQEFIHP